MKAELPRVLRVKKPRENGVPDIIHGPGLVFSRRLKDKLEQLEAGRHEFYPVRVIRDDDSEDFGEYYLALIHNKPDVIDFERTLFSGPLANGVYGLDAANKAHFQLRNVWRTKPPHYDTRTWLIGFRPGALEGLHLWRGTVGPYADRHEVLHGTHRYPDLTLYNDWLARRLFASDELVAWMKAENVRGWCHEQILQKPVGWFPVTANAEGWQ